MEDTFDFMVNDEDEVMLLIFERSGTPQNPTFAVNPNDNTAILHRNDNDEIFLNEVPDEIIDSLQDADNLLVCELSHTEKEEDAKIVNAYEADIIF